MHLSYEQATPIAAKGFVVHIQEGLEVECADQYTMLNFA